MLTTLSQQPLVLFALLLFLGAFIGQIKIWGVHVGPAAVLFSAIAVSAWGASQGLKLQVPEAVGTLGLALFTYTVGVVSGPSFFASLRRGWPAMVSVVGIFVAAAGVAVGLGKALGLSSPVIAGTFAGALTNTPALAAASAGSNDPAAVTTGYSIAYLWGVVGMILATAWTLSRRTAEDAPSEPLSHLTIRVEQHNAGSVEDMEARFRHRVTFTRIKHDHYANPTQVASDEQNLGFNDLVTVVGPTDLVHEVAEQLGHASSHNIVADRRELDYRRVTVSNVRVAGRTLAEIDVDGRFGAQISRVRRGDVDVVAHDDFVLQLGDRVRVIAPSGSMAKVSRFLGDSDRGMSDINPVGFTLGLLLGALLGLVHLPLPGGGFEVGAAAGTLIVGLIFGRVGRLGPVVTSMAHSAANSLSYFGMITFLAYAGTRAGDRFAAAFQSSLGWKIAVLGFVLTSLAAVGILFLARRVHGLGGMRSAGVLAGAQTQPAVLAFANERAGNDSKVALGYALVYPAAMIAKIVIAQLLA